MPETEPTELQAFYMELGSTALALGVIAAGLIIFLLAIIAVRGLASW